VVSIPSTMEKWAPGAHGGTYGGNAVGTAAAYATLQVIKDENLVENAEKMGHLLGDGLRSIMERYPVIGEVRGYGLMVAAEFVNPDGSPNPEAVAKVIKSCQDEKLLLLNCGTWDQAIRIIPPLVVNAEQIAEALTIFERAVTAL
jgi:4-aminobutyrate aminotransferase